MIIMQKKYKYQLPSNLSFGIFFSIIFFFIFLFFFIKQQIIFSYIFIGMTVVFVTISFLRPKLLTPFNFVWMKLGYILGKIISPIILGLIFYFIVSPVAIISKVFGRDELNLKRKINVKTSWIYYKKKLSDYNFKKQF